MVKAKKKALTETNPKEKGTQTFAFGIDGDKCTWERKVISLLRSMISKSIRLRWNKRFQEGGVSAMAF